MAKNPKYSKKEVIAIRDLFDHHDLDRDGKVTPRELHKAMMSSKNLKFHDMFHALDLNCDGVVTFNEYIRALFPYATANEISRMASWAYPEKHAVVHVVEQELTEEQLQEMRRLYNLYDKNRDGQIDQSEFKALIAGAGYNESDADDLFKLHDKDHNSLISFDEFLAFFKDSYQF